MVDNIKRASLMRPTADTRFHIDFEWWQENDSNWRIFLHGYLCEKHQEMFQDQNDDVIIIDTVDPETAEIRQEDGLLYELMNHCARQPEFINDNMPLVAKVFRIFLANGNQPLSAAELSELVKRPTNTVLVTLTGPQVYKGIRIYQED
ncbi:MAG: hypothetical protein PWQ55_474 [Chloroflexota bacterium]|nr:hypothetical protein [Chloroflexota bacterium]